MAKKKIVSARIIYSFKEDKGLIGINGKVTYKDKDSYLNDSVKNLTKEVSKTKHGMLESILNHPDIDMKSVRVSFNVIK